MSTPNPPSAEPVEAVVFRESDGDFWCDLIQVAPGVTVMRYELLSHLFQMMGLQLDSVQTLRQMQQELMAQQEHHHARVRQDLHDQHQVLMMIGVVGAISAVGALLLSLWGVFRSSAPTQTELDLRGVRDQLTQMDARTKSGFQAVFQQLDAQDARQEELHRVSRIPVQPFRGSTRVFTPDPDDMFIH